MSDTTEATTTNVPASERTVQDKLWWFDDSYRLEYDVVRCTNCLRTCTIDHAAEDFQHSVGCRATAPVKRPWQVLAAALVGIAP